MNEYVITVTPTRHPDKCTEISVDADSVTEALGNALAQKRRQLRGVRYAGDYHGPSYGSPGYPSFEGFTSLAEAAQRFTERQGTSGAWPLDSAELVITDGVITDVHAACDRWPATSPEDELDLYSVFEDEPGGSRRVASEPFARLFTGPRGGIVRENY